jgi:hypothetical protein
MKTNKFEETKIKLVMQLRGLTREEAVKALDAERTSSERADADVSPSAFLASPDDDEVTVSARDFFGD